MRRVRSGTAAAFFLAASAAGAFAASSAGAPLPFTAHYEVRNRGLTAGHVTVALERTADEDFVYRRESRPSGLLGWLEGSGVVEESWLPWRDRALRPVAYRYDRTGFCDRHAKVQLDGGAAAVHNTLNDHTWSMPVPSTTVDKLSVDLVRARELDAGHSLFGIPVADGGHLKTYRFAVQQDAAEVEVPAGRFGTVVRRRTREAHDPLATTFWLASERRCLPVKIERHDDGYARSETVLARLDLAPDD